MSEVVWRHGRCILCLGEGPLTREHVIPAQLGGALWVRFLCQRCNSELGARIEGTVREDPSIRLAVAHLQGQLPGLENAIQDGLPFVGTGEGGRIEMLMKDGRLRVRGRDNESGSLILPSNHGRRYIASEAHRRGLSPEEIGRILNQFDNLPENAPVELLPGYEIVNWRIDKVKPVLDGPTLSQCVLLKIAFEFLACHIGDAIYDRVEQLENLRSALLGDVVPWMEVEHLTSRRYQPIHGLALEDEGHVVVHVCLFRWIHYRIHLLRVRIPPPFFAYTNNSAERTERCGIVVAAGS